MNKAAGISLLFAGAAIGTFLGWYAAKNVFEKKANDEITSVKEAFMSKTKTVAQQAKEKPDVSEYADKVREHGYIDYSDISKEESIKASEPGNPPYVISPDQFGESDYDKVSLNYFSDQVLTDDDLYPVENIEATVGLDFLNHFGEYEDDSVFIRNDKLQCDYEILLDLRKYREVVKDLPPRSEE